MGFPGVITLLVRVVTLLVTGRPPCGVGLEIGVENSSFKHGICSTHKNIYKNSHFPWKMMGPVKFIVWFKLSLFRGHWFVLFFGQGRWQPISHRFRFATYLNEGGLSKPTDPGPTTYFLHPPGHVPISSALALQVDIFPKTVPTPMTDPWGSRVPHMKTYDSAGWLEVVVTIS